MPTLAGITNYSTGTPNLNVIIDQKSIVVKNVSFIGIAASTMQADTLTYKDPTSTSYLNVATQFQSTLGVTTNFTIGTSSVTLTGRPTFISNNFQGTLVTAAQPNITSLGTLTGLTVTGPFNGVLSTAAQPNVTSVGALSSLNVTGALTVGGALNGVLSTASQPNVTGVGTLTGLSMGGSIRLMSEANSLFFEDGSSSFNYARLCDKTFTFSGVSAGGPCVIGEQGGLLGTNLLGLQTRIALRWSNNSVRIGDGGVPGHTLDVAGNINYSGQLRLNGARTVYGSCRIQSTSYAANQAIAIVGSESGSVGFSLSNSTFSTCIVLASSNEIAFKMDVILNLSVAVNASICLHLQRNNIESTTGWITVQSVDNGFASGTNGNTTLVYPFLVANSQGFRFWRLACSSTSATFTPDSNLVDQWSRIMFHQLI